MVGRRMNTSPTIAPIDGGALRLLYPQRDEQFRQSSERVGNRVCAPGGVELPPRFRWLEVDSDESPD